MTQPDQERTYSLLPPPRLLPYGEMPVSIAPHLRDLPPAPVLEDVGEWEIFETGPAENQLTDDEVRNAEAASLADRRVQQLLNGKRYIPIGASLRETRDEPKAGASLLYIFYDYVDNLAVEVALDRNGREVAGVQARPYQPAPLQSEIDQAIALARQDSRLAERLTDDLQGTAILVSPVDPQHPQCGHRQFDVRFGCANERLPRHMALVDLSTETVLSVGGTCDGALTSQEKPT